jgi:hypothetical protein
MFFLSIGGYPVGYTVKANDRGELSYKMVSMDGEEVFSTITPSPDAWVRFWRSCKRIGVDKWHRRYEPESFVCDGTSWAFDIQTPELTYTGEGANSYPAGFEAFCSAVSRLVGGLRFN